MRNRVRVNHPWEEGALGAARRALALATTNAAAIAALPPAVLAGNLGKVAEYVQTIQGTNGSVAPGSAVDYTTAGTVPPIVNTIGITTAVGPGGVGTAFHLPPGTYLVDWENSNGATWSLAVYQAATVAALPGGIIVNSVAGATTAGSWIHGRYYLVVTAANPWIMVSPVVGTQSVGDPTTGSSPYYITRATFLQLS